MTKEKVIQKQIRLAWGRTAVFLKLVRHKSFNWNLPWPYDTYAYTIINHFRKVEANLNSQINEDKRWWDRRSKNFVPKGNQKIFDQFAYDEEIREIIKSIDLRYTENNNKTQKIILNKLH